MVKLRKSLGQNFLLDKSVGERMVVALNLADDDLVVEIGSGNGAVTEALTRYNINLYATEIDKRLIDFLKNKFPKANVVNANILKWLPDFKPYKTFKIIGSLPYYITSPILHETVRCNISTAVFLVQKEVAKKISISAPNASYLSTFIQTFFSVTYLEMVDRNKFEPAPKVDSAVLQFVRKPSVNIDINKYEKFLHQGFSKPRKMLKKVLPLELLEKSGVNPNDRPQHIPLQIWIRMFKAQI